MALTKKEVTKQLLEAAAQDLNIALVLSPLIPTDGKFTVEVNGQQVEKDVTKSSLGADLVEFGNDDLQFDDLAKLKPETIELLEFLGVKMPVADVDKAETPEKEEVVEVTPDDKKDKTTDPAGSSSGKKKKTDTEKSRYGHQIGSQAAAIDDAVFKGGTLDEMAKETGLTKGRIKGHIKHLRDKKQLVIDEKEGVFKVA